MSRLIFTMISEEPFEQLFVAAIVELNSQIPDVLARLELALLCASLACDFIVVLHFLMHSVEEVRQSNPSKSLLQFWAPNQLAKV